MQTEIIKRPPYEALNSEGYPYWREAQRIHELPMPLRGAAMEEALPEVSKALGMAALEPLRFGLPVYAAFGIKHRLAARHENAKLLMTKVCDLSLDYVPAYRLANHQQIA